MGQSYYPLGGKQDPGELKAGPGKNQYPECIREMVDRVQLGRARRLFMCYLFLMAKSVLTPSGVLSSKESFKRSHSFLQ